MSSRCRDRIALSLVAIALSIGVQAHARDLVVCADPDDLPYSRADESGFENRIAQTIAAEVGATLRFVWQPFRRGVVRKTLDAHACDVLIGVPVGLDDVATTAPYYRSGYAFVYRRDDDAFASFDDPRLRRATIGVQLVGSDMAATPAALSLARRGVVDNVRGFPMYGAQPSAQRMIDALDRGAIDVALIWGPQAGYFARNAKHPLAVSPATDRSMRTDFAIAMAVRRDDLALRDELDRALASARARIDAILDAYAVPRVQSDVTASSERSE